MKETVLIIGAGGREHALAVCLSKSPRVKKLYALPGNAGIAALAECAPIKGTDLRGVVTFVNDHPDITHVMVAPDDPLAAGLVDMLQARTSARVFGPSKAAALLEASKVFSKELMKRYNIPTAAYAVARSEAEARAYCAAAAYPLVIKADGLALGKGVKICPTAADAARAIDELMVDKAFGAAGASVVIEEFLKGFEVSVLAFTDGKTVVPMISSQDHKRALDGDAGLNTGGMGTYAPNAKYTEKHAQTAMKTIFQPTVDAMAREGRPFKGVLYFGLMIDGDDIRVLEYNARFGDPETQVVLPLLETDLLDIFDAVIDGRLDAVDIRWKDAAAVCVVAASKGYPEAYETGKEITFTGRFDDAVTVYHAGTARRADGALVTAGGRVLGVTAVAPTVAEAREIAYKNLAKVRFEGLHARTDIAVR